MEDGGERNKQMKRARWINKEVERHGEGERRREREDERGRKRGEREGEKPGKGEGEIGRERLGER